MNPKVSILMNCYNGEAFLKEAIDSVFAQTYKDWEIIFWDNNSTDNSANIAKSYGDRLRYFKGLETVPLYAARNLALKEAKGEFVAFLDVDDFWHEKKLEEQIPLFENPKVGLVYCDSLFYKEGQIIHRYFSTRKFYKGNCFEELFREYFLPLEAVVVRMQALKEWPYAFDDRFSHIGDADLFRRIALHWQIDYVDKPLAYWRVHSASLSWVQNDKFYLETERLIESYKDLIPGWPSKYQRCCHYLQQEVAVGKAKKLISHGKGHAAIVDLIKFCRNKKGFLLTILCLIPSFLAQKIIARRNMA